MIKTNAQELADVGNKLGIQVTLLDKNTSEKIIKRTVDHFVPYKTAGHLSIGNNAMTFPLESYEFTYTEYLKSEPAYIFFDQSNFNRNQVAVINDAKKLGFLMENSFGMEYFVSNESLEYLIAVNWYVIEASGSVVDLLSNILL